MAPGAPGANMAPARAPVELEFASGHVSATTQRKLKKSNKVKVADSD